MRLAVTSDTMSVDDMTVLVEDQIQDILSAVPGVADVQINGDRDKIFRIDINQARLASYGLTIADITKALSSMGLDAPAGSLRSADQSIVVRATANLEKPEDFENVYINGRTQIRDVATVTLGPDIESSAVRSNGKTAIGLGIVRQAQSNTLDISEGIRAAVANLQKTLPEGVNIAVTSDDANFINGAIHEVEIALIASVIIVVAIIFMFCGIYAPRSFRPCRCPSRLSGQLQPSIWRGSQSTFLPCWRWCSRRVSWWTMPLWCWKMLSGDAIRAWGRARRQCSARRKSFAVIATTLTLAAVFVPISFCRGRRVVCFVNSASCWRLRFFCHRLLRLRFARCLLLVSSKREW